MTWFYILSIAGALLLLLLLYREWTRTSTRLRTARCLASVVLMASLLGLCYPIKEAATTATNAGMIVLTAGYSKDSLTAFRKTHADDSLFSVDDTGEGIPVSDWPFFLKNHPASDLHVFGDGLSREQIAALGTRPIQFHPSPQQACITDIYWKQALLQGEQLRVQGRFHNRNTTVRLLLRAYGLTKDSATINADADTSFELKTIPLQTGTALYELVTIAGRDTIARESIPITCAKSGTIQLLILSSAPDFDNSYLKNTLAAFGYAVEMVTSLSSGKRERQSLNAAENTKQAPASFNEFDVVLADPAALKNMSVADLANLRSSISENGTGLIIKADTATGQRSFFGAEASFRSIRDTKGGMLFSQADSNRYPLPAGNRMALVPAPGQRTLLADASDNCLALEQQAGRGRIVFTTLLNSFSIALAGNRDAYLQLWSTLLEAAGQRNTHGSWRISPLLARAYEPQFLQWETDGADSMVPVGTVMLAFSKDTRLPGIQHAVYWPEAPGWHATEMSAWYVFPQQAWQQLRSYQQRSATLAYANKFSVITAEDSRIKQKTSSYSQLLFLILFLGAAAFLWMEQKQG